jgi:hypothetical protein
LHIHVELNIAEFISEVDFVGRVVPDMLSDLFAGAEDGLVDLLEVRALSHLDGGLAHW